MKRYHVVCEHCGETFIENAETRVLRVLERHRSKDGSSWCPEHVPDWVAEWREHQRSKKKTTT